jgi:sugar phosphate isomerase/epimerase
MARYGLRMGALQSPFGKVDIDDEDYRTHLAFLPNLIEQAHFFGTNVIRVFPFWQPDRTRVAVRDNLRPMLPRIADQLQRATRLAEQEDVFLALEPEGSTYGGSASEMRMIIDAVGSPALRVAWDVSNGWLPDEPPFPTAYEQVKGMVVNVHVKDRAFPPGQEQGRQLPCLLGTGVVPWPQVIRTLKADGYQGVFTIETHFYQPRAERGKYGWAKLRAATTWYMYALRELLEENA